MSRFTFGTAIWRRCRSCMSHPFYFQTKTNRQKHPQFSPRRRSSSPWPAPQEVGQQDSNHATAQVCLASSLSLSLVDESRHEVEKAGSAAGVPPRRSRRGRLAATDPPKPNKRCRGETGGEKKFLSPVNLVSTRCVFFFFVECWRRRERRKRRKEEWEVGGLCE